jgi:integrase/recombinase XerD
MVDDRLPLLCEWLKICTLRNLSPRTIDSYTYHVDRFAKHFGKDPAELALEEVRDFQLWMIKEKKSWSQFNQAVCGLLVRLEATGWRRLAGG